MHPLVWWAFGLSPPFGSGEWSCSVALALSVKMLGATQSLQEAFIHSFLLPYDIPNYDCVTIQPFFS